MAGSSAANASHRRFKTNDRLIHWALLALLVFGAAATVALAKGARFSTVTTGVSAVQAPTGKAPSSVSSSSSSAKPSQPAVVTSPAALAAVPRAAPVDLPREFGKVIPSNLRTAGVYNSEVDPDPLELAKGKCRRLFDDYPPQHQSILKLPEGDANRRVAVFKKGRGTRLETGGIGDFAGAMVGTLLVALATGRAYQLYWPIAYFGFSSPFIDTRYTDKEAYLDMENPPGFGLGHCCDVQESEDKRAQHLLALGGYSDPHWDFFKEKAANGSFEAHFSHPVEIFDMNKGLARHFLSQEQIDSKSWLSQALQRYDLMQYKQAFGCGVNFLIQLLPEHTAYIQPLSHLLRSKKTLSICIHLRTGDQFINTPHEAFCSSESSFLESQHAFLCAQQLEDRFLKMGNSPVWYLATDNSGLRIYAKSEYPDKLIYFVKPPNREYSMNRAGIMRDESCSTSYWWTCFSQEKKDSIIETMQDWHLFSMCDYHVVSGSGFSSAAVGRSMKDGTAFLSGSMIQEVGNITGKPYGYLHPNGKQYVVDCSQPTPDEQVAAFMGGKW